MVMQQTYGFLCCGPSAERNVYYSSDDDSDDGMGLADSRIVSLPEDNLNHAGQPLIHARGDNAPKVPGRVALIQLPREPSLLDRFAENWKDLQSAFFSPRPGERKRAGWFFGGDGDGSGGTLSPDATALNLAFKETHRLPDVAGEERVLWAAGIVRIDLTETGIRTLRGLDAFPNVNTLVLDRNGLLSLPLDCPWVPSLETLWLCNNEIENLDGLLCQVNDAFPRLTSLALMGNPVWPAAKVRARADRAAASVAAAGGDIHASQYSMSSARQGAVGGEGGGEGAAVGIEGKEEAAYRLHVVRRLPGLLTLDSTDVTDEERARAQQGDVASRLADVTDLMLEAEPTTDVEESLPRDTPPGSTKSVSHGVGKLLDGERERRRTLPNRSTLPSTWFKDAIVMDVGSGWTKMGLAGEDKPSCVFPSLVGRVNLRQYDQITGQEERVYVGYQAVEEATKRAAERDLPEGRGLMPRPVLLHHPMSSGIVTDWDDMEELWRHGIEYEMGLDPMEHPVLMADSTATAPGEREKATEVLFETSTAPALHMALQPVLALYACGPSSGLVVDIGESGAQVAPIFDGFVLERGVRQLNLGGKDITRQLGALVNAKAGLMGADDFEADDPCDVLQLEAIKASMCFVSENVDQDNARMEMSLSKTYTLPDGTTISLGRERYRAAELLFDPGMVLRQEESLQNTILDAILACERKTWPVLAQAVILTGGSTEMSGLNRRLQRELTKTSRASGIRLKFTVMVPEDDHNNTVWVGGSMLASTGALDGLWFTRAEYEEYGAGPIHAKFAA